MQVQYSLVHSWSASHTSSSTSFEMCSLVSRSFLQSPSEPSNALSLVSIRGVPQKKLQDVQSVHWQKSVSLGRVKMCQLSLCYSSKHIVHCFNEKYHLPEHARAPHSTNKSLKEEERHTFAFVSDALFCFLKIRARSSPILGFYNNLPCSRLGSTVASRTAIAPSFPIANLAVN